MQYFLSMARLEGDQLIKAGLYVIVIFDRTIKKFQLAMR